MRPSVSWLASIVTLLFAASVGLPTFAHAVPVTLIYSITGGEFNGPSRTGPVLGGTLTVPFPGAATTSFGSGSAYIHYLSLFKFGPVFNLKFNVFSDPTAFFSGPARFRDFSFSAFRTGPVV